ncbi:MAG TPA: FecR domain-containing protein [Polyangiaceae bacterium]|nr:FecR domain-containing protein [Polyangiaceae bacterium]
MTDDASEVRRLLGSLRDRPVSVDPERLAARRERVVAVLKRDVRALAAERVSRARRRAGYVVFSLAAAASVVFGVRHFAQQRPAPAPLVITFVGSVGQATARASAAPRALRAGESLLGDPGEIETVADGSAELVTSAGLGLNLGGATRVSLSGLVGTPATNQVELRRGYLNCSVPHLQEGQRFSVQTPDARVVVHGTVFSVLVDANRARGSETCVEVTDGVVIVQHDGSETALNRGDSWGCEAKANADPSGKLAANPDRTATAPGSAAESVPDSASNELHERLPTSRSAPRVPQHGTLAEESRLLQEALRAERTGQSERAQSLLNQLLARYPNSPLSPEARRASARIASASAGK